MQPNEIRIRWMRPQDKRHVLEIEDLCFTWPWSREDFERCFRAPRTIAYVAEYRSRVVGYMIVEMMARRYQILNFAVVPRMQGKGVGRKLATTLIDALCPIRRKCIGVEVRERNVDAQLFWRAMGFRVVDSLDDYYDETDESAYVFEYRYQPDHVVAAEASCEVTP